MNEPGGQSASVHAGLAPILSLPVVHLRSSRSQRFNGPGGTPFALR